MNENEFQSAIHFLNYKHAKLFYFKHRYIGTIVESKFYFSINFTWNF